MSADDGPLWIPDRDAKQWVQAHPKGQIAASTAKNKATDGHYVPSAKLLKSWRDRLPTEKSKPKSYILETLIHQTIGSLHVVEPDREDAFRAVDVAHAAIGGVAGTAIRAEGGVP